MKRKLTPLAQVLVLVDSLSADELATLADYLRGKLPQTPRKTASKKSKVVKLPENPEDFHRGATA